MTLRAIPGQTLQFTLYGHDINSQRDVLILRPEHDMDIDLMLHKR